MTCFASVVTARGAPVGTASGTSSGPHLLRPGHVYTKHTLVKCLVRAEASGGSVAKARSMPNVPPVLSVLLLVLVVRPEEVVRQRDVRHPFEGGILEELRVDDEQHGHVDLLPRL